MADYSGAYERTPSLAEREVASLRIENKRLLEELEKYREEEHREKMKRLNYSESDIENHVECNRCFSVIRGSRMSDHRDMCK